MLAGEYCNRDVIIVGKTDSVVKAAKLMRKYHVGDVLVIEPRHSERVPIGILTDRDIVIGAIANDLDANDTIVEDIISFKMVTVNENEDLMITIKRMRVNGIRRIPVVNKNGGLVGILAVDDVLDVITEQLVDIDQIIIKEQKIEKELRV